MKQFNPGCGCGCCHDIGFDTSAWSPVVACCSGMSPVINIASDVSKLTGRKIVFAGYRPGLCGLDAINFASADWPAS